MNISIFPHIRSTRSDQVIPLDLFLEGIREGQWQDDVIRVRGATNKEAEKKTVPYVTISGEFGQREIAGLIQHSGFIAMDIDDVDVMEVKSRICCDPYLYACFVSISGTGLCCLFRINPDKHLESFLGLQEYLFRNYEAVIDIPCKDVSRARFVSWDPGLYLNTAAKKFTSYPKQQKAEPTHTVVFVQADFDDIVRQIMERRIDITGGYHSWLKLCFALCDKLGEHGRSYFHSISQYSTLYAFKTADKQYTNCLKAGRSGVTIASFYYLCKEAGIETMSAKTKHITQTAVLAKKGQREKGAVVKLLHDLDGIMPGDSQGIIDQVFDNNAHASEEDSVVDQQLVWLRQNYSLRFNQVTRMVENNGVEMTNRDKSDIFVEAKKIFNKLDRLVLKDILSSNKVQAYHPITAFIDRYQGMGAKGAIKELFSCIESPTGWPGYVEYFGTKWLVGMIAGVYGYGGSSPLMLVLCGEKVNTGKTEFFKQLLPPELRAYFAKKSLSDMNNESMKRDLEIAMSRYLLILDDEMGGKSKRDEKKIKNLLSADDSTHRAAYAEIEERRVRLCAFGGTSNDLEVIGWDVGRQRRTVPVEVTAIDFARINKIGRIELFMEAYDLYKAGYPYRFTDMDIDLLDEHTERYRQVQAEQELVVRLFRAPQAGEIGEELTVTEVRALVQGASKEILSPHKISKALKDTGIKQIVKKISGVPVRLYILVKRL